MTKKTDIFSMGCTFYEICFFSLPYTSIPSNDNIQFIKIEKKENKNYYSKQLLQILDNMVELDQEKRKSSEEIRELVRREYTKTFLKTY